ncbi:MAG: type IX secretion system membrane protein PorP/SprF [Lewinellaceae bacterium]|nr:type IX secretion system membrane protein PorP/SprF [Lewinellaceae bacterium]
MVDFSTTQIAVSLAYHKALGVNNKQFLTVGLQGGLTQRNVSYGSLHFHDEFDGTTGYSGQTAEVLPGNNFSYPDYSAGLNYTAEVGKGGRFYAGAAIHHFLQPNISFYENKGKGDKLYTKYSSQLAANLPLTRDNRIQIHPRFLVAMQGPHMELNTGTNLRFAMGQYGSTALQVGSWARSVRNTDGFGLDAIVALVGRLRTWATTITRILSVQSFSGRRQTADGRRQTADGRRQTADGRRQTADGRRQTAEAAKK